MVCTLLAYVGMIDKAGQVITGKKVISFLTPFMKSKNRYYRWDWLILALNNRSHIGHHQIIDARRATKADKPLHHRMPHSGKSFHMYSSM